MYTVKTRLVDSNTVQFEISKPQHTEKKTQRKEQSRKDIWETARRSHISALEDSERKERETGTEANI